MKRTKILAILVLALALIVCQGRVSEAVPMGTAFTYQGFLYDANSPANDIYDFKFELYDANNSTAPIVSPVTKHEVDVLAGLFKVQLDFGDVFSGDARWFEIGIRPGEQNDPCEYSILHPRQELTPSPHAIYANAAGSLTNIDYWKLTGNAGTNDSVDFLGTTNDVALEIRVNNKCAIRIEPDSTSPNIIGGFSGNTVTTGAKGATISGGGADLTTDQPNIATDDYCTVSGGRDNQAGDGDETTTDAMYATVCGGWRNKALGNKAAIAGGGTNTAGGAYSAIGGGSNNEAAQSYAAIGGGQNNNATGGHATIGGGRSNTSGFYCTVAGGDNNQAGSQQHATVGGGLQNKAFGQYTTIGGGLQNVITAISPGSTIGGGQENNVDGAGATLCGGYDNDANNLGATVGGGGENRALGQFSTIGGGFGNMATGLYSATVAGGHTNIAGGEYSMVPGGTMNEADGNYSFAAGRRAKANHNGTFVWADSTDADFASTGANQFLIRADGGVGIGTTNPNEKLEVSGNTKVDGDLVVTGAYRGNIGPNNGAPFPRPAFDSGWHAVGAGISGYTITHSLGGDPNNYVVDMQFRTSAGVGLNNLYYGSYSAAGTDERRGAAWWGLTDQIIKVTRQVNDTVAEEIRIRIWIYN